jgi:hypothetical protein
MQDSNSIGEKRTYPRSYLNLPVEFKVMSDPYVHGAMIVNASEKGLLVQSRENIPVGAKLSIAVLFSKGFQFSNLEMSAEMVWTKIHPSEGREGYQFGLKFIDILEEDRQRLKNLFGDGY